MDGCDIQKISIPSTQDEMCKFTSSDDAGYKRILHQILLTIYPSGDYPMEVRFNIGGRHSFQVVDMSLLDPINDNWGNNSKTTPMLVLRRNGSAGRLILLNNKTSERLSVTVGTDDNGVWGSIQTDLSEESSGDIVTRSDDWNHAKDTDASLDPVVALSLRGTDIVLVLSPVRHHDREYEVRVLIYVKVSSIFIS